MSLNTSHQHGGVWLYYGEHIVLFSDNVSMEFTGHNSPEMKGTKQGKIYLTTHRMVFTNKKQNDPLQSFSFPFVVLRDVEIEQPVFGANYIKGNVMAQEGGKWNGQAKFKLVFSSGGAIDFGRAMLHFGALVSRNQQYGPPPPYAAPNGPTYPAPPPAYHADPTGYYGWTPPVNVFPNAPPANSVYMTDMPPPYPGVYGASAQPYAGATGSTQAPAHLDAKAAEAAQSAYYDPNKPQYAYVPPPAYYENPPSYQQAMGKKNH